MLELAVGFLILLGGINAYSVARGREFVPIIGGGLFHRPPEGWFHWNATYASLLPVLAAIYVLVRGLDNVGEGLDQLSNRRWAEKWRRVFPRRRSP
jgi:hypothetical protein